MIALGSDHAGFSLKEEIKKHLDETGVEYVDVGCYSPERFDYAISAQKACDKVVSGECTAAILCCGTGVGISMAANKVKGIRACCCSDYFSAKYTRLHNDVNKYRTYLSMYNDYMFDYDTVTDMFSLYIYRSFKATIICKMTLDKFEKVYMEYLNNARQKQDFTDFVNKVRNANEGFNGEITGPLITDMSKLVVYNIDCKLTYKNNRDRVVIGIIKSIDKQNEVSYYATQEGKDFFTGLLNKRACKEYVQDSIATNKDIHYMAMIDIDNFKNVNDTYGHLYGDKVILKVAAIINSALNGRGIVGRFGGDEFFIFTNWITKESQLRSILTFIKQKVRAELGQGENSCDVTLSMGVCKYPDNGSDYDSLFNKADKCLYIAKNKGKNRYIIYDAQKHGDFLDDMGRKGFSMAPIKKGETLAQEVADMSIDLIKNGSSVLDNVLQRACKAFEIDASGYIMEQLAGLLNIMVIM